MIFNTLSYWFTLSFIYLAWLTWQDYKNNMYVDDRRNWFMIGLTISIFTHVETSLLYKLSLSFTLIFLNLFMRKIEAIGEADINTLSWLFLGYGLIHYSYFILFAAAFTIVTILYLILMKIFKIQKSQFYGVILLSFMATTSLLYLGTA